MFKPMFAPLVRSGAKRQTIRPVPKRMPKVGDHESWREWSGKAYRSKQNELAQVEVTSVEPIAIGEAGTMKIDGRPVERVAQWELAKADGFNTPKDMAEWFAVQHGLPFAGILIRAKDL
jgi:hypothetical protein